MTDKFQPEKRSQIMANIKGRNTSPEKLVKGCLRRLHIKYRSNVKTIEGTPDIAILGKKKLIFVHGCFWHGHKGCSRAIRPESNKEFWNHKIDGNIKRDARILRNLKKNGWQVLTVWQCQTKSIIKVERKLRLFFER
ncbi:MAG: very short patch repair endonuclease [Deltaproteobacteria bacterium]